MPKRPDKAASGKEKRIDEAEKSVMDALKRLKEADVFVAQLATMVGNDGNRTLLRRYLNQYTSRNTMDYFIHKDLGRLYAPGTGFLYQKRNHAAG